MTSTAHADGSDDRHCQVCHIGHAAIPKPAAQVAFDIASFPSFASLIQHIATFC